MISTASSNSNPSSQIQLTSPNQNRNASELASTNSNLSSRIIPKIGSIVKRFSLNYSGEGLVTDPQRVRTVRVGIRFQVQVDSFLNNSQQNTRPAGNNQIRPRGITRTNSAPHSIQYQNNLNSDTSNYSLTSSCDSTNNNRQFIRTISTSNPIPSLNRSFNSVGNLKDHHNSSELDLDSSSGVSSLGGSNPQSPVIDRRHSANTTSLAFHNRINQALSLCRNQLTGGVRDTQFGRRSSVQVYRRGSSTPDSSSPRSPLSTSPRSSSSMEDSSSYQVLRYFPGSNVNNAQEFSWETAAFEKDVRDRVQWLGSKFSGIRTPPFIQRQLSSLKIYAKENPFQSVIILAVALACSLPISIFLGFAIATIFVSFLGFLFVEGTLLTVASVTFGSVVLVLGLITLFFVFLGSIGYFTTSKIYSIFTGGDLRELLEYIPLIGKYFTVKNKEEISRAATYKIQNGSVCKIPNGHGPERTATFDSLMDDSDDADEEDADEEESTVEDDDEGHISEEENVNTGKELIETELELEPHKENGHEDNVQIEEIMEEDLPLENGNHQQELEPEKVKKDAFPIPNGIHENGTEEC